jgi:hypothetical protein
MQRQVARLLRIAGTAAAEASGKSDVGDRRVETKKKAPAKPKPIQINEPPTYVRIVGDPDEAITFYADQRRYVRLETDANSDYHDPHDATKSRINIIVGDDLRIFGTSPLRGGRMRVGVQCKSDVPIESTGSIRVELYRPGLSALTDERGYRIVESPQPSGGSERTTFPNFKVIAVDGPDDVDWEYVSEGFDDRDVRRHATGTQLNEGVLYIYYSTAFPRFSIEKSRLDQQSPSLSASFQVRYELWLAVHALLVHQDEQSLDPTDVGDEAVELARMDRCRFAAIAAMMASQEIKSGINFEDADEAA